MAPHTPALGMRHNKFNQTICFIIQIFGCMFIAPSRGHMTWTMFAMNISSKGVGQSLETCFLNSPSTHTLQMAKKNCLFKKKKRCFTCLHESMDSSILKYLHFEKCFKKHLFELAKSPFKCTRKNENSHS